MPKSFAVAFAVHAALGLAMARLSRSPSGAEPPVGVAELEVDVEATPSAETPNAADEPASEPPTETPIAASAAHAAARPEIAPPARVTAEPQAKEPRGVEPGDAPTRGAEAASPATAGSVVAQGPDAPQGWSFSGARGADAGALAGGVDALGLSLTGPNHFVGTAKQAASGPTAAEQSRALTNDLRDALVKSDVGKGLGSDGPVVAALSRETYDGDAPVNGRAVFAIKTDATGVIVGFSVESASGEDRAWAGVAARAAEALAGKKLRVPPGAKGVALRIEVQSALKLPSGHDPGANVEVLGIPVKRGAGPKATAVKVLPLPKLNTVNTTLPDGTRVSIPQIDLTLLAVNGDPSDIGARPRRIVHTHLLEQSTLR